MTSFFRVLFIISGFGLITACKKSAEQAPGPFSLTFTVNGSYNGTLDYSITNNYPVIRFSFSEPLQPASVAEGIWFQTSNGSSVAYNFSFENNNTVLEITPVSSLAGFSKFTVIANNKLLSGNGGYLSNGTIIKLSTAIDSSRKFPAITDDELLTRVQEQTFRYFWDFGHPVSGLARERSNGDNNIVTSGGSGFGIMAIITGIERGFITRAQGLARLQTMVSFLKNTAEKFRGAFPHWLNGATGKAIPFSINDNGADLVETSYLVQGLLCARQYFNAESPPEAGLRNDINSIWNAVEWDWFRQNDQQVLYWHWSQDKGWIMNMQIKGWNECLITYILAASSPAHSIPKSVYDNGWASNGSMKNGNVFYGFQLPLGPAAGGPLFFSHYSFLGINPNGLSDAYADYETQTKNHTLINYNYCKENPGGYFGYSDSVWGLTASDIPGGYAANSPTNDRGVITPSAALSSFPYTPAESMAALHFFYYVLGDRIWKQYGFADAFSLEDPWFADSFLAIDQGPIIVMIENYRSGLLWELFTSCPEIKTGMTNLGFTAPYL